MGSLNSCSTDVKEKSLLHTDKFAVFNGESLKLRIVTQLSIIINQGTMHIF